MEENKRKLKEKLRGNVEIPRLTMVEKFMNRNVQQFASFRTNSNAMQQLVLNFIQSQNTQMPLAIIKHQLKKLHMILTRHATNRNGKKMQDK